MSQTVSFVLGDLHFEYDEEKNRKNIRNHGISFRSAARVFFDYDRIEFYDEKNSIDEDRYDVIGNLLAGKQALGKITDTGILDIRSQIDDILFVVYTERETKIIEKQKVNVIRLISARMATSFERGLYYGKYD